HTLNLAWEDPGYRSVLCRADVVFADGTGAKIAARLRGVRLRDNLVGTDLVPALFERMRPRGCRVFLLGATAETVKRAARHVESAFGVEVVGAHHGYVDDTASVAVVERVNTSGAHLLLVGMGNPLQETWIDRQRERLGVPVAIGVGGLFDHWGGNLRRAAPWVRRLGIEWVQILLQQPGRKWRRYLVGNPVFLARALRDRSTSRPFEG
ncbi:MAG: WecB/TagA/CpsF family glycosyltransferase, partial [Alphaproteobacteria bacterium]